MKFFTWELIVCCDLSLLMSAVSAAWITVLVFNPAACSPCCNLFFSSRSFNIKHVIKRLKKPSKLLMQFCSARIQMNSLLSTLQYLPATATRPICQAAWEQPARGLGSIWFCKERPVLGAQTNPEGVIWELLKAWAYISGRWVEELVINDTLPNIILFFLPMNAWPDDDGEVAPLEVVFWKDPHCFFWVFYL